MRDISTFITQGVRSPHTRTATTDKKKRVRGNRRYKKITTHDQPPSAADCPLQRQTPVAVDERRPNRRKKKPPPPPTRQNPKQTPAAPSYFQWSVVVVFVFGSLPLFPTTPSPGRMFVLRVFILLHLRPPVKGRT